jgi:hypothetical protein
LGPKPCVIEFMEKVISLTGLSEEEYWQSPEVIQAYREELVENKLFKKELLNKHKNSIHIDKKMLDALNN